jgi:carbamoyl-phosphate synthase large subunit
VIESYRDLDVWQEAMMLVEQVYALSRRFPTDEHFGLSTQLRTSAVSIPSRIAEGNASDASGEYLRFISLAAGSTAEVQTQLLVAGRLKLAEPVAADAVLLQCDRVGAMLRSLRDSVDNSTNVHKH